MTREEELQHQIDICNNTVKAIEEQRDMLKGELLQLQNPNTSQVCPNCGSTNLIKVATQNLKLCTCGAEIPWNLDKGQAPLL